MTDSSSNDSGASSEGATTTSGDRWTEDALRGLISYPVVDRDDEKIGTVSAIWEDGRGEPAFLGIRTGWFGLGKTHIVPAHSVQWSQAAETIRLPFSVQAVKEAPTFDEEDQLDPIAESKVYSYYQRYGFGAPDQGGTATAEPPATSGGSTGGSSAAAPSSALPEAQSTAKAGTRDAATTAGDERVIPLREEELVVGKRQVEAGGVRLRKIVRIEVVNQPVEVMREDVVIERVPASGDAAASAAGSFTEEEIYVPLRREEAVVGKRAHVREEVRVRKTEQVEQQPVNEQLRSEDVQVERDQRPVESRTTSDPQRASTNDPQRTSANDAALGNQDREDGLGI